jgi:hypothetical protein
VNLQDINLLAGNFGLSAGPDGIVDPADWAALASAVPEPSGLSLAVMGAALLTRRNARAPKAHRSTFPTALRQS